MAVSRILLFRQPGKIVVVVKIEGVDKALCKLNSSDGVAVGLFASTTINPGIANGLVFGGLMFFNIQILGVVLACTYSFIMTWGILKCVTVVIPVKVSEKEEKLGLDMAHHGEAAYSFRG